MEVTQIGQWTEDLLKAGQKRADKQAGGTSLQGLRFQRESAVERFDVGNAVGWVQQWTQHPLGVGRSEGADVGIEKTHDFSVLTGNAESLPDSPAFAWWAGDVQAQIHHGPQQLLHCGPVGPVHLHRKGHL